ncbi:MAG TPA: hypothetical protein VM576_06040 [Xanthomonadaceae bacterium]|nr:hypothetical protein [Xanthomonadaceae bacterium]
MARLPAGRRRSPPEQLVFLGGLGLLLFANLVLLLWSGDLPKAVALRSSGFAFPALEASGQPLRNLALILLVGLAVLAGGFRRRAPDFPCSSRWLPARDILLVAAAAAFLLGACLAYPPQISATNFRIIWVDWAGPDLKIRYFGQLLRELFYGYPHLLQGAATLVAFLALQGISRRIGYGRIGACVAALVVCASSVFVEFSGVGEDWTIVSAASLVVLWAYAARRWGPLVIALVVLGGLRLPSALLLLVAVTLTEALRAAALATQRPVPGRRLLPLSAARLAGAWLAVLGLAYLAYLHFTPLGDDMGTPAARELGKIAVDGFSLTPLSGVYLGHALWALPAVVTAACVAIALTALRHLRTAGGRTALASALAMGGSLLFYEIFVEHQFYYNYRYLALAYPLGIPALLFLLARAPGGPALRMVVLASLLVWNPVGPAWRTAAGNLDGRQQMEHELYSCREVFAPWLAQRQVYVRGGGKALSNAIEYIKDIEGADTSTGVRKLKRPDQRLRGGSVLLLRDAAGETAGLSPGRTERVAACRGWVVLRPR